MVWGAGGEAAAGAAVRGTGGERLGAARLAAPPQLPAARASPPPPRPLPTGTVGGRPTRGSWGGTVLRGKLASEGGGSGERGAG